MSAVLKMLTKNQVHPVLSKPAAMSLILHGEQRSVVSPVVTVVTEQLKMTDPSKTRTAKTGGSMPMKLGGTSQVSTFLNTTDINMR